MVQRSAIRSTIEDETDVDHVMQLFKLSSARNAHKIMQISDTLIRHDDGDDDDDDDDDDASVKYKLH